jgi:hypothetical protein
MAGQSGTSLDGQGERRRGGESFDVAEDETDAPEKSSAYGVKQAQHAEDLQEGGPVTEFISAAKAQDGEDEPDGIVKIEVSEQEIELFFHGLLRWEAMT